MKLKYLRFVVNLKSLINSLINNFVYYVLLAFILFVLFESIFKNLL